MTVPTAVSEWLAAEGHGEVTAYNPVAGGCINSGARLETSIGGSFFIKQNPSAPPLMFKREWEGLGALSVSDGPLVPKPLLAGESFLLLEDLRPAPARPDYWKRLGNQLAALHNHIGDRFGFEHDNFIGSTPQPNPFSSDGFEFFAEHRLLHQAAMALDGGQLSRTDARQVRSIARRLREWIPEQPASLIHGDLWSGNATTGPHGEPAIIDPAAHFGWAEAELGMTSLFGGFSEEFYTAYEEVRPLQPDWRARLPIYNLYHLLNHLNLFGASYLGQVRQVLRRFG